MPATASDLKVQYAQLLYERMLGDKYLIQTCFTKKYTSYSSKEAVANLRLKLTALS